MGVFAQYICNLGTLFISAQPFELSPLTFHLISRCFAYTILWQPGSANKLSGLVFKQNNLLRITTQEAVDITIHAWKCLSVCVCVCVCFDSEHVSVCVCVCVLREHMQVLACVCVCVCVCVLRKHMQVRVCVCVCVQGGNKHFSHYVSISPLWLLGGGGMS